MSPRFAAGSEGAAPSEAAPCLCDRLLTAFLTGQLFGGSSETVVLDLGCGMRKLSGSLGVDHLRTDAVDLVCDLDHPHWPIASGSADVVWSNQVIEHVHDPIAFIRNVAEICRNGADVVLLAPHFSSVYAWTDPTHRHPLGIQSMDYMLSYMPREFEIVHRFFGARRTGKGWQGAISRMINASFLRQQAYERWVTPVFRAGLVGFHLRRAAR